MALIIAVRVETPDRLSGARLQRANIRRVVEARIAQRLTDVAQPSLVVRATDASPLGTRPKENVSTSASIHLMTDQC